MRKLFPILIITLIFSSCINQEENIIAPIFSLNVPSQLGEMHIPLENPITKEGIELGKTLFFDPILSDNNKVSCASCHFPELAFSDGKSLTNSGVSSNTLIRHSPTLFNLAWHKGYFWDGGAKTLASQTFGPLTHADEMGSNLLELVNKLNQTANYPSLFEKAFDSQISSQKIAFALTQYQLSLISAYSPYDDYLEGKATLSTLEQEGLTLFNKNCSSCHQGNHFSDFEYHNNGLDSTFNYEGEDPRFGRYRITLDKNDLGKYKTPSLRNIALTAPYMHNGRFKTLEDVLNHYTTSIKKSETLADELTNKITLTTKQKSALIAFLQTLTDEKFIEIHTKN